MRARLRALWRSEALPNTGSVARDLLAAERTFLAWARTGLGLVALGVALEKVEALEALAPAVLHSRHSATAPAAGALVAACGATVALGTRRYFVTLSDVRRGVFRPNAAGVSGIALAMVGVAAAGALAVVEGARENRARGEGERRGEAAERKG